MIALASVRGRAASFVATFAAVALGVALITMTLLVYSSAAPRTPERLAGAPVVVHGPVLRDTADLTSAVRPWPAAGAQRLAGRLAAVPGVASVVPDRSFYAQLLVDGEPFGEPDDPAAGHGWSSAALGGYRLAAGAPPVRAGQVAAPAGTGLGVGAATTLLTATGPVPVTVTGLVDGPGVYLADAEAARLAPGVAAFGLTLAPDADPSTVAHRVRAALRAAGPAGAGGSTSGAGAVVATGDRRAALEPERATKTRWLGTQLLIAMASLAVFVTVFVVASTFALNAVNRRREIGLLRTVGATPGQVRRLVLGEASLVGTAGAVTGALLGTLGAYPMARLLVRWGLANGDVRIRPAAWPVAVAVATGVVVALCGAFAASRRTARIRPVEAYREAAVETRAMTRGRWLSGGVAALAGGLLAARTATATAESRTNTALLTAMALIVAAALLAPLVVPPLARALTVPAARGAGAGALLVRAETLTAVRRTAATAAPVIATVGFAVLLTGMVATMREAYPAGKAAELRGVTTVVPDGTPGLSDATVAAAGGRSALLTRVFLPGRDGRPAVVPAAGTEGADAGPGTEGADAGPGTDSAGADGTGWSGVHRASLSTRVAAALGVRAGSRVPVLFADGLVETVTVDRVRPGTAGEPELVLPRALVRAHDPSALTPTVTGADPARVTGPAAQGARVLDAREYAEREYAEDSRLLWLFVTVLVGLSAGYTGIAVLNTMAMSVAARRHHVAVLRRAGATGPQVRRFAVAEALLVVGVGALLGLAAAVPPLAGMRAGLAEELGVPVALRLHWPAVSLVVLVCALLAAVASDGATRRAAR